VCGALGRVGTNCVCEMLCRNGITVSWCGNYGSAMLGESGLTVIGVACILSPCTFFALKVLFEKL